MPFENLSQKNEQIATTTSNSQHPDFIKTLHEKLQKEQNKNYLILSALQGKVKLGSIKFRGKEIFPATKELIKKATTEVLIMNYKINRNCDSEKDLLEALNYLNQKAKEQTNKITIRILVNKKTGPAKLFNGSTALNSFNALNISFDSLDFQYAEHKHNAFGSYHNKMIIIDNKTAIISSCDLSIANNYRNEDGWIEISSILHGQKFVNFIRQDFIQAWNSSHCQPMKGLKKPINEMNFNYEENDPDNNNLDNYVADALYISKKAHGGYRSFISPYAIAILEGIRQAKCEINIVTPNLNEESIIYALADAVDRGVKVNIVMGKYMNDETEGKLFMGGTNRKGIKNLLSQIKKNQHLIDVRWATDDSGKNLIRGKHKNTMHARVITVDNEITFIGSSVLDKQSLYHSRESDVIMHSKEITEKYNNTIVLPIFKKSRKFKNDETYPYEKAKLIQSATEVFKNFKVEESESNRVKYYLDLINNIHFNQDAKLLFLYAIITSKNWKVKELQNKIMDKIKKDHYHDFNYSTWLENTKNYFKNNFHLNKNNDLKKLFNNVIEGIVLNGNTSFKPNPWDLEDIMKITDKEYLYNKALKGLSEFVNYKINSSTFFRFFSKGPSVYDKIFNIINEKENSIDKKLVLYALLAHHDNGFFCCTSKEIQTYIANYCGDKQWNFLIKENFKSDLNKKFNNDRNKLDEINNYIESLLKYLYDPNSVNLPEDIKSFSIQNDKDKSSLNLNDFPCLT